MKLKSWLDKMIHCIKIWGKRATGIGYKEFPPIYIELRVKEMEELNKNLEEGKTIANMVKQKTYELENATVSILERRDRRFWPGD